MRMQGKVLNGTDLIILAESYTKAINQGAIPTISDAWSDVCENQCQTAVDKGSKLYERKLKKFSNEYIPIDPKDFDDQHH